MFPCYVHESQNNSLFADNKKRVCEVLDNFLGEKRDTELFHCLRKSKSIFNHQ